MPPLLTRETFIALRARRQAHQIARDILNPHMELPSDELVQTDHPRNGAKPHPPRRWFLPRWSLLQWVAFVILATVYAALVVVVALTF